MDIVVGFVDSPEGDAAVAAALEEARLRDARVVLVHSMVGGQAEDSDDYRESALALERAQKRLDEAGIEHVTHAYVRGQTPSEDVMAAVAQHDAGLIIIGIRTRSTTGKFLLGSNALDILHDAEVPVLCVKRS